MNYLLVAATPFEIAPTVELIKKNDLKVDTLISGIGMLATAYHLTRKLADKKYDLVIQAGIAVCFDKDLQLGDVVMVKDEIIGDLGVKEKKEYKDLFDMNFLKPNEFPYSSKILKNKNKEAMKLLKLPKVSGVTVNQITTSKTIIDLYVRKYNAVVESMEGAALHYICSQEKTSFLQLRSISNYVGERNKSKWKIKDAIENLNAELMKFVSAEL
jgi:futalosine hydrolase